METWHLTFSADGRSAFFPTRVALFTAVRTLVRVAGERLVLFGIVDDHLHVVLNLDGVPPRRAARSIRLAFRPIANAVVQPADVRLVDNRGYMQWLLTYVPYQPKKHELPVHPALWTGGCFLDLVGARCLVDLVPRLRLVLPRFRLADAFQAVSLPQERLVVPREDQLSPYGMERITLACEEALCTSLGQRCNRVEAVAGRMVAIRLCRSAGVADAAIRQHLSLTQRGLRKLAQRPLPQQGLNAVLRRLALEDLVENSPPPPSFEQKRSEWRQRRGS